jgi:hypothetical protein
MLMQTQKKYSKTAWSLFCIAVTVPFIAWGSRLGWDPEAITLYSLFPLLGLWAWSVMWTHYAYGSILILDGKAAKNKLYKKVSGWFVLAALLLHPGLLALAQWQSTDVLPPESYYLYVGQAFAIFITLGFIAINAFLAYEILERLRSNELVERYWKWMSLSQALAMILIFIHAMALGQDLGSGWFQFYWVILGALLIPCFGLILRADWRRKQL